MVLPLMQPIYLLLLLSHNLQELYLLLVNGRQPNITRRYCSIHLLLSFSPY